MAVGAWTCVQAEQAQATQRPECSREVDQNNNGDRQRTLIYLSYLLSISETIHRGPIVPDGSHRCRLPTDSRGRALIMALGPRASAQKKARGERTEREIFFVLSYLWDHLPDCAGLFYTEHEYLRIADRFSPAKTHGAGLLPVDPCGAVIRPLCALLRDLIFSPLGPACWL